MVSRYVAGALGALALGADAISTRPYGDASTTTICADDCWSTTTLYSECTEVTSYVTETKWSTSTIWGDNQTSTATYTEPASTITSYITISAETSESTSSPNPHSYGTSPTSQPSQAASTVTAYVTTSIYIVSVQPGTTETDWDT